MERCDGYQAGVMVTYICQCDGHDHGGDVRECGKEV